MISVNCWCCCFIIFICLVWSSASSGVCVCEWCHERTLTELHSMCLCNLKIFIFFFFTLTFLCRLPFFLSYFFYFSSDERVFFCSDFVQQVFLFCVCARLFFIQFSGRVFNLFFFMIIVAFTLMWKMSSRDKNDFFFSHWRDVWMWVRVSVCICACDIYEFWFVVAMFIFASTFVSLLLWCLLLYYFTIFMVVYFADGAYAFQEIYTASPRKHTHILVFGAV